MGTPQRGRYVHVSGKKLRFSTEIADFLANRMTQGALAGSHRQPIDQCRFQ